MPRNGGINEKAIDLHNILFEQAERLNDLDDEEMQSEKLAKEIQRAEAINKVAAQIISNGRLVLDSMKFSAEAPEKVELPEMFSMRALPEPKPGGKK